MDLTINKRQLDFLLKFNAGYTSQRPISECPRALKILESP
jgi:hypothetical protein